MGFFYSYYGLMMWFPELFNRFDEYARAHNGSEQALVCEVCVLYCIYLYIGGQNGRTF